jgi:radical SAM protein with 4Fe4S-binding SPASM domain
LLTATILWDGSVTLCPYDVEGKMVVGNVKTQSFIDIWRSERSQAFRAAHLNLDFAGASEFCGVCRDWYHNI